MYYSGLSSRRRKPAGNQMSQAGYDGRLGSELQCFFVQRTCRKRMSHRHQDYSRQRWENYDERFRVRLRREYFAGDDDPAEITWTESERAKNPYFCRCFNIKAMNLCDFMAFIFRNVVFCICSGSAFSLSAEKRTRNIGINGRNSA